MSKSNVIPMPEPERDPFEEFRSAISPLSMAFERCAIAVINRLEDAEQSALERIAEYTPQDRLLNLKEAAAYLGFKPRTLRDWCSGEQTILQHSLIGGELRFRKAWLDAAVERRSVGPKKIKL